MGQSNGVGGSVDGEYSTDTIHHILRNTRRRAVLFYLKYHDTPVEMRDLTREIAAWEFDKEADSVSSEERERVYVSLHQTHLPTLDEKNIITYDKDRKTIDTDEGMSVFDPYIDPKQTDENVEKLVDSNMKRTVYAGLKNESFPETTRTAILRRLTPTINSDERWSTYYLAAAGLSTIFIWLASPLSPVSIPMAVAAITQTGMFAALAFIHAFVEAEPEEVVSAEEMFLGSLRPDWADGQHED